MTIFMVINIKDFEFDENVDNGISRIDEMYGNEGLGRQMKIGCQIRDGGHHSS